VTEEEKTTVLDTPVAEEAKTEEAKTEEAKADEAKTDEAKADEAKTDEAKADEVEADDAKSQRMAWGRVLAYGVLPGLALLLALTAGFLKYVDNSVRNSDTARIESLQVAKDSTAALLSYQPDKVERQLTDARSLLTGDFQNSYTSLINDVVIPGAKQKQISAVATVPAAASVSADPNHAVVLVFVNQTVVVGTDAPTDTASSVRVTLQKSGDKWLISEFQPV
jgi:Mce-associated membrane protein